MKIAVDCFGGDHSPDANIEGSLLALKQFSDLEIILIGDEDIISEKLKNFTYDASKITILDAKEVIDCNEKPTEAIRKKESSMMKGIKLLREDDSVAGLVSTGSSGALVAAATVRIPRLRGVIRPAFIPILPTMTGSIVGVCDSGANVDVSPDFLRQCAVMGTIYIQSVFGIESPKVGLLNVGVEEEKGDALRKKTYPLLKETPGINFVGNMESRNLMSGDFNLVVCDGFSGNVLVKSTEGACLELLKRLKKDIFSKVIYQIGALFMKKMFDEEKKFFNYQNYGGSVLLGSSKVIVKGHGSSKATAVAKCIEQAYKMQSANFNEKVEEALASLPEYINE